MSINPAIEYCNKVVNKEIPAPKYVKKQCKEFLNIVKGKSSKYFLDIKEVQLIENATKLMNMASGLAVGKTVYESLVGFQWFFIIAILCVKHKNNPEKRRYESATLLISRKNGKTFLIAVIFTILLIIEPKFSEFYSVAADGELSRIVKKELDQLIVSSPLIDKHFKIKRDVVECQLTKSMYKPLNYSNNRLDGRKSNVWLADEVGALPERYAISAMKSSQINMLNRLGIMISTAYPSENNPMIDEVTYAKKVLDGAIEDDTYFSLLYEPDNKKAWKTNDNIIFHSNPLALDIPDNLDYLYQQRKLAIEVPTERTNFLTKHLNIFLQNNQDDMYLDIDKWKVCGIDKVNFAGKEVTVAFDLSLTTDLTAVSMMYKEDEKYFVKSIGFLPEESLANRREKIDYRALESENECIITKGAIVDYNQVEKYIRRIEEDYQCSIKCIVADPFNATQMLLSLAEDYEVIELKQSYTNLSPPTKEFRNEVYKGNVFYEKSKLFDWNVSNAITRKDKSENEMLDKANKNKQRIDLIAATIFAFSQVYQQEEDWAIQVI
ncbi:MAG: terminase large subunit [Peptostreptococcaceae bacterium]|nr:terminase large subunit [Peptostreptococcaceae bacterium]